MDSHFAASRIPPPNERRAQPRQRTGGDFVVIMLTVLGGLFAIAVVALVLL